MMRSHVTDDWRGFHPKTNVFWLHYLADKLLEKVGDYYSVTIL